jgi:aryl-alcohol dehydrogenase-like predicted oxidoreductase
MRDLSGEWFNYNACSAPVKNSHACGLNRLGVDCIDIYRLSRLDPNVPTEETIGTALIPLG